MAPLSETIAVIDKSGKIVSSSKHLFGVFREARDAYRESKAQVISERNAKIAEQQALKALQNYHIDDSPSVVSSRRSRRSRSQHHSRRSHHPHEASSQYERSIAPDAQSFYSHPGDLVRRHTDFDAVVQTQPQRPMTSRSKSEKDIDMDLAYGECHHSIFSRSEAACKPDGDQELKVLVSRTQRILDEANCLHSSAQATINHLQKNPDAMAAVALTLAEISNLVTKMAPSVLAAFKAAAPTVFGLLASPQFLIAAGLGVGVTVVMFGGYKIIKRIQASDSENNKNSWNPEGDNNNNNYANGETAPEMDEMIELNTECLSHVEMWRRGVADVEAESYGTSVDGEFITPIAARLSGIDISTASMRRDPRFKFYDDDEEDDDYVSRTSSRRSRRSRATGVSSRSRAESHVYAPSQASSRTYTYAPSRAPTSASRSHVSRAPTSASRSHMSRAPSSKHASRISEAEKSPKEKKRKRISNKLRFLLKT